MLTTEELLRPRYKVLCDYPGCEFAVGEIIPMVDKSESFMASRAEYERQERGEDISVWHTGYFKSQTGKEWLRIEQKFFEPYPHIFEPLKWCHERDPGDLPEYVRFIMPVKEIGIGSVKKVNTWYPNGCYVFPVFLNGSGLASIEPATEAEYITYIRDTLPIIPPHNPINK